MLKDSDTKELLDILEENYYSIGITSGHEALGNLLNDFFSGNLDEFFDEQEITKHEFHTTLFFQFAKRLLDDGKMWTDQHEFYKKKRNASS